VTAQAIDFGLDPLAGSDLHRRLAALREKGRSPRVRLYGSEAILLTRFDDVLEAFRDDEALPGGATYRMSTEPVVGRTFISMDGREHRLYRKLATPAFQSAAIARFHEQALVALANELIDRFAGHGAADLVRELTTVLPYYAITRKLGIPRGRDEEMRRWADGMLSYPRDPTSAVAAAAELSGILRPLVAERRAAPGDDLLSALAHAEVDGERLAEEEILAQVRLLFAVGATTTSHAMGNLFATLLDRPALLERARAEPSLLPGIVHELLRWEGPLATLPRWAPERLRIAGEDVPGGTLLLLGIAAANRDPRRFSDPERFDPERPPQDVVTFGFGVKFCPGSHLARRELLTALEIVLERLPGLRLADGARSEPRGGVLRKPESLAVAWDT
jgi:cytochrome P450